MPAARRSSGKRWAFQVTPLPPVFVVLAADDPVLGLLPLLKSIHKTTHLRNFSGQTLGIDAYGWLHRGTVACAVELAQGKPTRKHIEFALHRVRMLIHFGVKPYLVFDGDYLPSKAHTEKERAARRKESKRVGLDLLRMGRATQAQQELQKAIDVTPLMARELIEELKRMDVPYVVAPYEADSQLAYLEKQGIISGVLSEDSDLLVFGVKCLLTKLDQYGECVMIDRADFTSCREISLVGWTDIEFRMMAMLSGCDYLPGIEKLGLKTAYRLIRKHKTIEKIIRIVQFDGKMKIPAGYLESFTRAERTFLHQWVYCPKACQLHNLTPLPAGLDPKSLSYLGKPTEPDLATGVANGDLDPNTKRPIVLPSRFQDRATGYRAVSTPAEKQGKPITEFFRKRTPLAELDPNSFTPSPSQHRLLQSQPHVSWSASQFHAGHLAESQHAAPASATSSAPQPSRRVASLPTTVAHQALPKRQRLCSDTAISVAMNAGASLESATSRFFSDQHTQASPSLRKKARQANKQEFELWSDDSVAEALLETAALPIPGFESRATATSTSKKRKKLTVFVDTKKCGMSVITNEESQSTGTSTSSIASLMSGCPCETPAASVKSNPVPPDTASLSNKSPAKKPVQTIPAGIATVDRKQICIDLAVTQSAPSFTSATGSETPTKQAQHNSSVQISASPDERSTCMEHAVRAVPSRPGSNGKDCIANEEWLPVEGEATNMLASGLAVRGSEDFLVPDSPEGGAAFCDDDDNDDDDGRNKLEFNLGRFVYAE